MKKFWMYLHKHWILVVTVIIAIAAMCALLVFKLGTLVDGLSQAEKHVAATPIGWHGLYRQPLYLPLGFVRSIIFKLFNHHGQSVTRLPNVIFGAITIVAIAALVRIWHGTRIMLYVTLLFATSSWVLHVSRYASYDVLYLWALPALLLSYALLNRYGKNQFVFYIILFIRSLLIFIPGLVWFVLIVSWWQYRELGSVWKHFRLWWQRLIIVLAGLCWTPLLILDFVRSRTNLVAWLGMPNHFATPPTIFKNIIAVGVHLFIRGPEYPTIWLGRAPILDVLTLTLTGLGIYFYIRHWQASRSRMLFCIFAVGILFVGIKGPVSLSILVPECYLFCASGLAYLLHSWLKVFPRNPIGRGFGIGLVAIAVAVSCSYNLQAYFVAWPHNSTTQTSFRLIH